MKQVIKKIAKLYDATLNRSVLQEVHDAKALQRLEPYIDDYLPWTGSALRPSAVAMMYNEIVIHNRSRVLEIGCGMSTVMLSKFLSERGASMVSLENDKDWITVTQRNLGDNEHACEFIQAELVSQEINGSRYKWYDLDNDDVVTKLSNQPFDVLLVDAPIANTGHNARYPALHKLRDYLAEDFVVFLDDIDRKAEEEIASEWCKEFDLEYQKSGIIGGLGIMRPRNSPNKYNIS